MQRETISHAYVVFTSQLYGGKVVDYDNIHYKKFGDPDVINDKAEQIFEVKSSLHKRRLDLKINQIMNYERAQKITGFEQYYMIWAFNKRKRKHTRTVITHDTVGLLALSLDILSPLVDPVRDKTKMFFDLGLSKEFWRRLHFHPYEGLEILGLKPRNYCIDKRKRIEGVRFRDKHTVKPFEMTTITNKKLHGLELLC